jgi:hypothetical protein
MIVAVSVAVIVGTVLVRRFGGDGSHRTALLDETAELVEFTAACIGAGLSPMDAVTMHAELVPGTAGTTDAARAWREGRNLDEVLGHVSVRCGDAADGWCQVVRRAMTDGQNLTEVLARLSLESHATRERIRDEAVARLPVRLALPLVACILPSYVLLAAIPIMAFARMALT